MKKWSVGGGVAAATVLLLLASISIAFAALTFNGTSITGDSTSTFDATGTISIGATTATGITIGRSGVTSTFPGPVNITGTTTYVQNLVLNGSCTGCGGGSSTPPPIVSYVPAAVSDGGVAFAAGLTRYDNNAPQAGSVNTASSSLAYLAFNALPVSPQYAEQTIALPPYWTGTYLYFNFYSAATTGNVTWEVQSACTGINGLGAPTFGTPVTVTTAVSGVSDGLVATASTSVAINGVNGCPSTGVTTPTLMTYRVFRASSDTASGNANLLGVTLVTGRSQ